MLKVFFAYWEIIFIPAQSMHQSIWSPYNHPCKILVHKSLCMRCIKFQCCQLLYKLVAKKVNTVAKHWLKFNFKRTFKLIKTYTLKKKKSTIQFWKLVFKKCFKKKILDTIGNKYLVGQICLLDFVWL